MNSGKCPTCEAPVTSVAIEEVDVTVSSLAHGRGLSYLCPCCRTVLSVSFDPLALKADLVAELQALLNLRVVC